MSTATSTTRPLPTGGCARRCSWASTARRWSKTLFAGKQAVADSFVEPLDAGYHRRRAQISVYDPARAKQLLEEAGWHAQPDGSRKNADGKTLSFELATTAGNRSRELVEQVLQSQWKEIGVDIRIHNEPARVLFGDTLPHRHFDLAMYAWMSAPENSPRSIFRSNEVPNETNGYAGENLPRLQEPRDGPPDRRDRGRARSRQAQGSLGAGATLYATDLPSLPLYFRSDAYILPKWLSGVRPTGNQYPTTLWSTDWGETK